jgi:endoglucanase
MQHRGNISMLMRQMGFNSVRLPYSDEMVMQNPTITPGLLAANLDLIGKSALEIFHAVVESMTGYGLLVIPNNHITQATCC